MKLFRIVLLFSVVGVATVRSAPPAVAQRDNRSAHTPQEEGLDFRICAMTVSGTDVRVGVVHKKTGQSRYLRPGQATWDGLTFVAMDFDEEQAWFRKDGKTYAGKLESGGELIASVPPEAVREQIEQRTAEGPVEPGPAAALPAPVPTGDRIREVTPAAGNDEIVVVRTDRIRLAVARRFAEGILGSPVLSDEQKIEILHRFPGSVPVAADEDPVAKVQDKEAELAVTLTPPGPPPDVEIPPIPALPPNLPPPGTE